jgi:hypothetical protein
MRLVAMVVVMALLAGANAVGAESRFGVLFGASGSRASGDLHRVFDGNLYAPVVGATDRQPLGAGWALRVGLEAAKRGATREGSLVVFSIPEWGITDSLGAARWSWYQWWIDAPLLAEKRWGDGSVRPYALAGPEVSWRTKGSNPSGSDAFDIDRSRRASVAVLAGAGVAIPWQRSFVSVETVARIALEDAFDHGPSGRVQAISLRVVLQP